MLNIILFFCAQSYSSMPANSPYYARADVTIKPSVFAYRLYNLHFQQLAINALKGQMWHFDFRTTPFSFKSI